MNAREIVVTRRIESRMVIDRRCFMVGLLWMKKGLFLGFFQRQHERWFVCGSSLPLRAPIKTGKE